MVQVRRRRLIPTGWTSAQTDRRLGGTFASAAMAYLRSVPAILIFAGALLWPIAWVAWNGWTLTGLYEASVGYRYFYTLRALYDPPTFLFLPQGQTTDLVQKLIQVGMTLAGIPPTQVQPRIDYFCYAFVAIFHGLNFARILTTIHTVGWSVTSGPLRARSSLLRVFCLRDHDVA